MRGNKELFKNTSVNTRKATDTLEKEGHTGYTLCKREELHATEQQKS